MLSSLDSNAMISRLISGGITSAFTSTSGATRSSISVAHESELSGLSDASGVLATSPPNRRLLAALVKVTHPQRLSLRLAKEPTPLSANESFVLLRGRLSTSTSDKR